MSRTAETGIHREPITFDKSDETCLCYNKPMNQDTLSAALKDLPIIAVRWHATIPSTNDAALAWADAGAPDGALIVADFQTAGRGRGSRKWLTELGSSLALSLVLHPTPDEIGAMPFFAPLAALAVCTALEDLGLVPQIKWPNDVLIERKKCCGILVEANWAGEKPSAVVIGIGVNVAHDSIPPDEQLIFPATCIESHTTAKVDKLKLLHDILAKIFMWRRQIKTLAFYEAWQKHLAFVGEPIYIEQADKIQFEGTLIGIDPQGSLIIKDSDDKTHQVVVGDVHLRPNL